MSTAPQDPPSGYVGHLTPEQEQALSQLKTDLQNEGWFVPERHDDPALLRFLRHRKFDLSKAKKLITETEEWRKSFGVDDLVNNFDFSEKAEVSKYYPQYFHKTDKDYRPVYIERLGNVDLKALAAVTTQERQLQRLAVEHERLLYERLPACSAAAGQPIETANTILDVKGISPLSFFKNRDYIFQAANIGENYYPETLHMLYIINVPPLVPQIIDIVKSWLTDATIERIVVLGSNYKKTLLEQIPAENLPADLGGACSCPGGCALSDEGPWNVPKYKNLAKSKTAKSTTATSAPEATPAA
ncbi:unnamed protein product [Rhizoctonia solani]|uniref:CRAL-TRIO domain-containing protein n=1 Tax=Rhizoctonia solani TaxID=456999 RepID=A0A8H3AN21_9AGAM|nr:unnamed protein product [Rhizoctonia solani]